MRRFLSIFAVAIVFLAITGCSKKSLTQGVEVEPNTAPSETIIPATRQEQNYQNFKGKTMEVMLDQRGDNVVVNLARFFQLAQINYEVRETEIVLTVDEYAPEDEFQVTIRYTPGYNIINGDRIDVGRKADGTWETTRTHESATDFIFEACIDDQDFLIGVDELDYLYRELRLLTVPAEKRAEVAAEIDAELASYWVDEEPSK